MVEHAIVNAKRVKRRKGDTGVASVVEEELLRVEEGPDEVFVGLAGGEEWVRPTRPCRLPWAVLGNRWIVFFFR
jgi:hypothetical protein